MKVVSIVELFKLNPNGGIAVWSKRLMDYLNRDGIDTKIVSYSDGIETNIPDFIKSYPNFREIFIYPFIGKKILPRLEREYDLIHLMSPHTLAWSKPKIPTLISIHYLISRQALMLGKYLPFRYKIFFNFLSYNLFLHYEAKGLQNASCITVSRQAYKEYLMKRMKIPEEKIRIVKYGIDYDFFKPSDKFHEKEDIALFVGRGSLPKGFDVLVNAAKQIKGKIVAVASQIPKGLRQVINGLNNFQVVAGISQENLRRLYQEALIFVMPSLTEGSPLSTLEAMACGLPVVCSPEGSGEYIKDGVNGYIFPFKDSNKLAEKVNFMFNHKDIAYEFGSLNRKKVETELTLPVVASQIKDIYKKLVNES